MVNNKPVRSPSATVGGPTVHMVENIMFSKLKERLDHRHVTLDDHIRATARSSDGMVSLSDLKKVRRSRQLCILDLYLTPGVLELCSLRALTIVFLYVSHSFFL